MKKNRFTVSGLFAVGFLCSMLLLLSGCNENKNKESDIINNYFTCSNLHLENDVDSVCDIKTGNNRMYVRGTYNNDNKEYIVRHINDEKAENSDEIIKTNNMGYISDMCFDSDRYYCACENDKRENVLVSKDRKSEEIINSIRLPDNIIIYKMICDKDDKLYVCFYRNGQNNKENEIRMNIYDKTSFEQLKSIDLGALLNLEKHDEIGEISIGSDGFFYFTAFNNRKMIRNEAVTKIYKTDSQVENVIKTGILSDISGENVCLYFNDNGNCVLCNEDIINNKVYINEIDPDDFKTVNLYEFRGAGPVCKGFGKYDVLYTSDNNLCGCILEDETVSVVMKYDRQTEYVISGFENDIITVTDTNGLCDESILCADLNGKNENTINIKELVNDSKSVLIDYFADDSDRLYILVFSDSKYQMIILDDSGKKLNIENIVNNYSGIISKFSVYMNSYIFYIEGEKGKNSLMKTDFDGNETGLIELEGKELLEIAHNQNDLYSVLRENDSIDLFRIDFENSKTEEVEIENGMRLNEECLFKSGKNNSVIDFCNGEGIFEYDLKENKVSESLNWIDSDIEISVDHFCTVDRNLMVCSDTNTHQLYLLRRAGMEELKKIQNMRTITLSGFGISEDIKQMVYIFNAEKTEARIKVKDYQTYEDGISKFEKEIATGKMPDILIDNSYFKCSDYFDKKGFLDLNELFLKENGLKREDFLENIISIDTADNILTRIPVCFLMESVMIPDTSVNESSSDDLKSYFDKTYNDKKCIRYTVDNLMSFLVKDNLYKYVNFEERTCNFNSQEFTDIIKLIMQYGILDDEISETINRDTDMKRDELELVGVGSFMYLKDIMDLHDKEYHNKKISISGQKAFAVPELTIAVNKKTENKKPVLKFVEQFLSNEYQDNLQNVFPVRCDSMQKLIDNYHSYYGNNDDLPEETMKTISGISKYITTDSAINKIIDEETGKFFTGKIDAETVSESIQSKVKLYLNEKR